MIKKFLLLAGMIGVLMCFTGICVYADNADKVLSSVNETQKASKSKKKKQKKQTDTVVLVDGVWTYFGKNGKPDYSYNGIASNTEGTYLIKGGVADLSENGVVNGGGGNWYYVINGMVQTGFTGLQPNQYGWWRIVKGKVDFGCNSVEKNEYGWWYVENGRVRFDYTGIKPNKYGWWRIVNGKVDFGCNSVEQNEYGWWSLEGGKVNFDYTGVRSNQYGWWYIKDGRVDFSYNGFAKNENGWWYVENGKVTFGRNDILLGTAAANAAEKPEEAYWLICNSKVTDAETVAKNAYGWWYVRGGKVDFSYNGLASNAYGTWAIENGKVNFNLNKYYFDADTVSLVYNGKWLGALSPSNATAVLSARSIAAQITNNSMTESQKIWACFDYTITHFRSTDNPRIPHYKGDDWIYVYANDMFVNGGGNCISFAAAFSLLVRAAGVNNVYACYSGAHAWTEINGLVYDPEQYHDTNNRKIYAWSYDDGLQNYRAAISDWRSAPWKYVRVPEFD